MHEPSASSSSAHWDLVGGHGEADQVTLEYEDQPLSELDRTLGDLACELGWGSRFELEPVPKPLVV